MAQLVEKIFCAACQMETDHVCQNFVDRNQHHEMICTCPCGRSLKFQLPDGPEHKVKMFAAHKASNIGQITVEVSKKDQEKRDLLFLKAMGVDPSGGKS